MVYGIVLDSKAQAKEIRAFNKLNSKYFDYAVHRGFTVEES